ncbi:hypothetical protein SO694_00093061 [Aureococcus anophagefferens]|uniref:Ion transport domain-containing protein n=1 Tax=Aureococcus anophagefferens TaxID=44056 RepID=A0ABR1FRQ2_AURAN
MATGLRDDSRRGTESIDGDGAPARAADADVPPARRSVAACETPSKRGLSEVRGGDLSWFCGLAWRLTGAAPAAVERKRAAWWRFFSDAESSTAASLYNSLLILSLVGSIATTFLETTSTPGNFPLPQTSTGSARRYREYEIFCTTVFSLDLFFRLLASERFLADRAPAARAAHQKRASLKRFSSLRSEKAKPFASDWRNWVDLAAVLPLYVSLLTRRAKWTRSLGVLRMLRCFRITSSYTATQVLAVTLKNVAKPLALPLFFLAVSALVCGSILFLLEPCVLREVCTFEGLWEAIYFVLVGMTTVTAWARAATIVMLLGGALFLSMPLAIIGIEFDNAWRRQYEDVVRERAAFGLIRTWVAAARARAAYDGPRGLMHVSLSSRSLSESSAGGASRSDSQKELLARGGSATKRALRLIKRLFFGAPEKSAAPRGRSLKNQRARVVTMSVGRHHLVADFFRFNDLLCDAADFAARLEGHEEDRNYVALPAADGLFDEDDDDYGLDEEDTVRRLETDDGKGLVVLQESFASEERRLIDKGLIDKGRRAAAPTLDSSASSVERMRAGATLAGHLMHTARACEMALWRVLWRVNDALTGHHESRQAFIGRFVDGGEGRDLESLKVMGPKASRGSLAGEALRLRLQNMMSQSTLSLEPELAVEAARTREEAASWRDSIKHRRRGLWVLLNAPNSSRLALVYHAVLVAMILASTCAFVLEASPNYMRLGEDSHHCERIVRDYCTAAARDHRLDPACFAATGALRHATDERGDPRPYPAVDPARKLRFPRKAANRRRCRDDDSKRDCYGVGLNFGAAGKGLNGSWTCDGAARAVSAVGAFRPFQTMLTLDLPNWRTDLWSSLGAKDANRANRHHDVCYATSCQNGSPGPSYESLEGLWIWLETPAVLAFALDALLRLAAHPEGAAGHFADPYSYLDVLGVLPYLLEVAFTDRNGGHPERALRSRRHRPDFTLGADTAWPMFLAKSLKCLRFCKLARYVYGWDVLVSTLVEVKTKLALPLVLLFMMNSCAALLVYYAEYDTSCTAVVGTSGVRAVPDERGCGAAARDAVVRAITKRFGELYDMDAAGTDGWSGVHRKYEMAVTYDREVSSVPNALEGWWLSFITMTAVGFGRITPETNPGQLVMAVAMICGQFYLSMPLTIVGGTFYASYRRKNRREKAITDVLSGDADSFVVKPKIVISEDAMAVFVKAKDLANELSKAVAALRRAAGPDRAPALRRARAVLGELLALQPRVSRLVHAIERKMRKTKKVSANPDVPGATTRYQA